MRGQVSHQDKSVIIPVTRVCMDYDFSWRGTYTSCVPPHMAITHVANNSFEANFFPNKWHVCYHQLAMQQPPSWKWISIVLNSREFCGCWNFCTSKTHLTTTGFSQKTILNALILQLLNVAMTQIIQSIQNFKNFIIYLYLVLQPDVRPRH